MENELSIKKDGLISLSENNNLGNMIKPLMREIHLFDFFIAGTTHLSDPSVLQEIKVGDKLSLMREDNKFDHNAILVLTNEKRKLGYIPEKDNTIFSRLMDAGKLLVAQITKIETRGNFYQISIGIYLVDF